MKELDTNYSKYKIQVMKQKLTYTEAVAELENILAELENNSEINMDVIAEKVKRAGVLMEFCKKQLHELDEELEKMMADLDA
ncbi:MAG: exodeoxyribonuclease VII small subunit [Paludibacter sp.]|nr:exodeoxyribonuclease VII small subunit [Paludibacter sp.]